MWAKEIIIKHEENEENGEMVRPRDFLLFIRIQLLRLFY